MTPFSKFLAELNSISSVLCINFDNIASYSPQYFLVITKSYTSEGFFHFSKKCQNHKGICPVNKENVPLHSIATDFDPSSQPIHGNVYCHATK